MQNPLFYLILFVCVCVCWLRFGFVGKSSVVTRWKNSLVYVHTCEEEWFMMGETLEESQSACWVEFSSL